MSPLKKHPVQRRLLRHLKPVVEDHVTSWERPVFRCVDLKWAHPEYLVTGEGTKRFGSRWMAKGITPVVYAASTESIALKEAKQNFKRYGIKPKKNKPRVIVEIHVSLKRVIKLQSLLEKDLK